MKILHTFCITFFFTISFSQPIITSDILPETGTSFKASYAEGTIDVGPQGENQNWDFSSLNSSFEINFEILEPEDAPGSENYPDAEYVWHLVEFENYLFYDYTDNVISQLGGVNGVEGDISFMTINTDWEDGFQLPFTYLDSYDFKTEFDNYLFGNYLSSGSRDATLTADAYGTIKTKYGTFENVLRVKIVREEFGGLSTQHAWLHPESFLPVMVYETDEDPETSDSYYFTDINDIISNVEGFEMDHIVLKFGNGRVIIEDDKEDLTSIKLINFGGDQIGQDPIRLSATSWQINYQSNRVYEPAILIFGSKNLSWAKKVYLY